MQPWRACWKMLIHWMKTGMMDKWEERQITDRQLERIDGPLMQREIVKGLMVTDGRAQTHRQIIRQAANAELRAVDHNQTRSTPICHVYPGKQMLSCQSCIMCNLTGCVTPPACCCLSLCVFLSSSHRVCVVNLWLGYVCLAKWFLCCWYEQVTCSLCGKLA